MAGPFLRKEGKHRYFDNLEFWAEEGLIFIEDRTKGDFNIVTCDDFAKRAKCINEEAKRAYYPSDRKRLQDCVLEMHDAWKEAKEQGDPQDVEVMKSKYRERRKSMQAVNASVRPQIILSSGW